MAQQSQGELLQQQSQPEDEDGAGEPAMGSRAAKPLVRELNRQIVCPLCRGYLIDATTLVECMHTFCRACIIYRLKNGPKTCPACDTIVFARPRADFVLQRLIYLVVPGLFKSELERRRVFRASQPVPLGAPELSFDDLVSLSLRELDAAPGTSSVTTRYLKCPAGVTVRHLTRLLMLKRGWDDVDGRSRQSGNSKIEMMHEVSMPGAKDGETEFEILDPAWTLMDLSCIFQWKREAPMRLYYRIIRVDEVATDQQAGNSSSTSINDASGNGSVNGNADASSQAMENIQRPPTPPPSPKPAISRGPEPSLDKSPKLPESPGPTPTNEHYPREPSARKKPRCEVTPVIRAPDPPPAPEARPSKSSKPAKPEHHQHKRKKRRNKRVIAEITTTPREDLLKLKFRLTPCPPRVVSSTAAGQTNDKIVQIRTVRKEKQPKPSDESKHRAPSEPPTLPLPPPPQPPQQQVGAESSEGEKSRSAESKEEAAPRPKPPAPEKPKTESSEEGKSSAAEVALAPSASKATERESSPKNEEVLRRLGLVAVSEANRSRQERARSPSQSGPKQPDPALEREKLEKRLRESKANRVRSLLAEKQMRDTLKSIMSSSKEGPRGSKRQQPASDPWGPKPEPAGRGGAPSGPKRKEPPPLTPLRTAKRPSVTFAPSAFTIGPSSKCDSPLDLSSPSSNALDLSAEAPVKPRPEDKPVTGILRSSAGSKGEKPREEPKKTQDTNLRTLSDAAVSLLGGAKPDKQPKPASAQSPAQQALPSPAASNKVALRIPQPHQRITGFGMKIKPNIGVRHIPNPQAVVVSQYRNQRTGYFGLAHQPP